MGDKKSEVFHISGNNYTYRDAQAVCTSLGAQLATYDQIEDAYNNGADWIEYGWSQNQYAYFPLQKSTWKNIQNQLANNPTAATYTNLDKLRPGISGGYFSNPYILFGVNCYGVKPHQGAQDQMVSVSVPTAMPTITPLNPEQVALNNAVDFYKNNRGQVIMNSFNTNKWSEY
jgi:hypothetical protein